MTTPLVLLLPLADDVPADKEVTAGGLGFAVFFGLVVVVAILCVSFSRRMKVARANMAREDAEAAERAGGRADEDAPRS